MQKRFKKILKYTFRTLLALLLLLILTVTAFFVYINTNAGKRKLASVTSDYLGKTLGTEVSIGSAEWVFPSEVRLHDVLIKDHRQKPMLHFGQLDAGLAFYDFANGAMSFSEVALKDVKFDLERYPGDSSSNFGFIVNRLSSGGGTGKHTRTNIMFNVVTIENMQFTWNDDSKPRISFPGIDWDHINVGRMDGRFTYFWIDGNEVSAKFKRMNISEGSGFVLKNMEGIAKYTPSYIEVKSMDLITAHSEIGPYFKMEYKDPSSLGDFIDEVKMTATFSNSKISFKDLAYFTPDLKNKTDSLIIANLEEKGPVKDMNFQDIDASFGNHSFFKGKAELKGLPNINETFMSIRFKSALTSREDLIRFLPEIELPEDLNVLGTVKAKGIFTGFINDFVTASEFETALGKANTDLNVKNLGDLAHCSYSGKLALTDFNIGKIAHEGLIGSTTMNAQLIGQGLTLETIKAQMSCHVSSLFFNNYTYHGVVINGNAASKFFSGNITVEDKNLQLGFNGTVDYSKPKPELNFLAQIAKAHLFELNLAQDTLDVASTLKIDVQGVKLDDLEGRIIAKNTKITTPGKDFSFDSINVNSYILPHHREFHVFSDMLMADINGDFQFSHLPDLLKAAANRYVDTGFLHIKVIPPKDQYVNFNFVFRDLSPVFSAFRLPITLSDSGHLKGSIFANDSKLNIDGAIPYITYKKFKLKNLVLTGHGDHNFLNLDISASDFIYKDSILVRDGIVKLKSNTDKLVFDVSGSDMMRQKHANLKGSFDVQGKVAFLDLDSSHIGIMKQNWNLNAQRITFYTDTLIEIPALALNNGNQFIRISGKYSQKTSYPVRIISENLGLSTISSFVPALQDFKGNVNGQVIVSDLNTKPIIEAAMYVANLAYVNDTFGTLVLSTDYSQDNGKLNVDAKLENEKQDEVATAKGTIATADRQEIALGINFNKTEAKLLEPFVNDAFSELKGQITADIAVTGTLGSPLINGKILISEGEMKVNYTNVKYHFSHEFNVAGRNIDVKNLTVYDVNNNIGKVNGTFDLSHLDNVKMNLEINAKNLMSLNTTQKMSDLYFGRAFGTGKVSITGPFDNLKFVIKMKTEKNTTFAMPVEHGSTFYGHDYIKFINKGNYLKTKHNVRDAGIELYMDLEITPDAFAQIIFDPGIGDILEAHGKGNLRLDINSDGDFNMFGTYTLTDGSYRFTAFDNFIRKSFTINSGSTIAWNGSPYEAQLNVEALYTIHTSLMPLYNNLNAGPTLDRTPYERVYPVDAVLNLTGSLFQPEIKLDFNIRELTSGATSTSEIDNQVRQIRGNEQDLNQQVVSLLVFNQFAAVDQSPTSGLAVGDALNSSMGDFVSNQLNYMLSKYSEDLHVGIDYRVQEEATFRISQDLLKQRVNLSGSYDLVNNNYNTQLSYKIRQDGSLQMRIFGRSNNNNSNSDPLNHQNSNTQGIGLMYRREFDKISELFKKKTDTKP